MTYEQIPVAPGVAQYRAATPEVDFRRQRRLSSLTTIFISFDFLIRYDL
jgi:hypothetical protein